MSDIGDKKRPLHAVVFGLHGADSNQKPERCPSASGVGVHVVGRRGAPPGLPKLEPAWLEELLYGKPEREI